MLRNSQTKVIVPTLALGVLQQASIKNQRIFSDQQVGKAYETAVRALKAFLGHDVHIGAKYEDAYGMRMSRYGFFTSDGHLRYKLVDALAKNWGLPELVPPNLEKAARSRARFFVRGRPG